MYLDELIAHLQEMRKAQGNVHVVCTAEYEVPVEEPIERRHLRLIDPATFQGHVVPGMTAPYLLVGGVMPQ